MQPHTHDPHTSEDTPGATHDPVCGRWVVPEKAHGTSIAGDRTVHFCSAACKRAFDAAPARWLPRLREAGRPSPARETALLHDAPSRSMGLLDKMRISSGATVTDPVCHMKIDPKRAAGKSEHEGATYYFCSGGCKAKFDADPAKFLAGGGGPHHMH